MEIYTDHANMLGYRFEFDKIDKKRNIVIYEYMDESESDCIAFRRCLMTPSNYDLTYEVFVLMTSIQLFKLLHIDVKWPKVP